MATIKMCTDIPQSKKLVKILSIKSADMYYYTVNGHSEWYKTPNVLESIDDLDMNGNSIACWSLTALLNYLKSKNKFPDIKELSDGRFKLTTFIWDGKNSHQVFIANNLVDACYKLVLKLHECEML